MIVFIINEKNSHIVTLNVWRECKSETSNSISRESQEDPSTFSHGRQRIY